MAGTSSSNVEEMAGPSSSKVEAVTGPSSSNADDDLMDPTKWSTEDEVYLLSCTLDNEPVGIDKHLRMSIIWSKFRELTKKNVSSDALWKKLGTWYNLEKLDEMEPLPISTEEEDFKLPSEIIPESYIKHLSEEEKKNIDFSGQFKKFISVSEPDEEDQGRLGGSEKMKWFECPQYYTSKADTGRASTSKAGTSKAAEKPTKIKVEPRAKFDSNESSNDSSTECKPLRKYGKATDITSGSLLTISVPPQLLDELDDGDDDNDREDHSSSKQSTADMKEDSEKLRKRKRGSSKKGDLPDDGDSPAPRQFIRANRSVESTPTSSTRLRKSSVASHEASSGTETEKECGGNEDNLRARRRFSTRTSTSESKPDPAKPESAVKSTDVKRKSTSRR